MGKNFLGAFEELLLIAIVELDDLAYGVAIAELIKKATGKSVSTGALYTALTRLELKGLITSRLGEATPERGGRAKKYFEVTSQGRQALRDAEDSRVLLKSALVASH